jgi:hypothetical protein
MAAANSTSRTRDEDLELFAFVLSEDGQDVCRQWLSQHLSNAARDVREAEKERDDA